MARNTTLRCDICGKAIEQVAGKVYIAPIVPGRAISYMSAYSHSGDACVECLTDLSKKLTKRKPRNGNGNGGKKKKRVRRKP